MSSTDKLFVRQLIQLIDKYNLRHLISNIQTNIIDQLQQSPVLGVLESIVPSSDVDSDDD